MYSRIHREAQPTALKSPSRICARAGPGLRCRPSVSSQMPDYSGHLPHPSAPQKPLLLPLLIPICQSICHLMPNLPFCRKSHRELFVIWNIISWSWERWLSGDHSSLTVCFVKKMNLPMNEQKQVIQPFTNSFNGRFC